MTAPLDALSADMEIVELLSTVFSDEYTQGVASSQAAAPATAVSPDTRPRRVCRTDGCHRSIVSKGCCIRHGGGKRCQVDKCDKGAKSNGVCWKHGGSRICKWNDCNNHSKARGLCWTHGGGKPCATADCHRTSLQGGHCWAHGGGKRCNQDGCQRPAYERNGNFCTVHSTLRSTSPKQRTTG